MENRILKKRKEIESVILMFIFLFFLFYLLVPSIKLMKVYLDIRKIKINIENLENKIKDLKKDIEFYSSNEGLERWIKENFKLTNDNEKIYIFIDD